MDIVNTLIAEYGQKQSSENFDHLHKIESETALCTSDHEMISGFFQGRLLSLISRLLKPHRILEIGTFTAYSAVCLAEGLLPDGLLITIESNTSLQSTIDQNIKTSNRFEQIEVVYGRALEILPDLDLECFDLIFVDATKKEYLDYYNVLIDSVQPGCVLIFDNILWKGEVINKNKSSIANEMDCLNKLIKEDVRVKNFIFPFRDGLNIITKL